MISIIIPTLLEEKIIESTLSAIKSKLKIPYEIIISDGGSKDKTIEKAQKYADKIVIYSGSKRQTIAQGRNDGAKMAQGDFFVFLDADCSFKDPNIFFEKALADFDKFPDLVGLLCPIRVLPEFETRTDKLFWNLMNAFMKFKNNVLHKGDAAGGEFQMVRRNAFFAINGYREDLVTREDRDLFMRLSKVGQTRYDPELVLFHTGRRSHQIGWRSQIAYFLKNTIFFHLTGRTWTKECKPVR